MTLEVGMSLPILVGARRGRPDADKGAQQARPDWAATDEVGHDATPTAFLSLLQERWSNWGVRRGPAARC